MTTQRRAKLCARCGFSGDHMLHFRNCVPTSQWPRALRERKAAAMGHNVTVEEDREPEPEKPRGLAEYRRLHPEANPLTTERITVKEHRKRDDGGHDEWERVVGVREAMNQAQPCPRCHRPVLDRSMHITCQPVDGSVIHDAPRGRLQRDDVPLTPRTPVIHTTDEVRTGRAWFEQLPDAQEPETDEEELRDFLGDPEPDAEMVDPEVLAKVIAEQEAWVPLAEREVIALSDAVPGDTLVSTDHGLVRAPELKAFIATLADPFTCPTCQRVSKSAAGNAAHGRSHKAVGA